jgi:hypothetical protein
MRALRAHASVFDSLPGLFYMSKGDSPPLLGVGILAYSERHLPEKPPGVRRLRTTAPWARPIGLENLYPHQADFAAMGPVSCTFRGQHPHHTPYRRWVGAPHGCGKLPLNCASVPLVWERMVYAVRNSYTRRIYQFSLIDRLDACASQVSPPSTTLSCKPLFKQVLAC